MAQFGHTGKTSCNIYLLMIPEILSVKAWHAMCFREKNNGGSNWAYKSEYVNTINVFIIETKPYTP